MTLVEKENVLFEEWKKGRDDFVSDGVVDENAYAKSVKKLIFVLKEVNFADENRDLRKFLRDRNERPQTWDNVTRWVMGIRRLKDDLPWVDLENIDQEKRIETLKSICAVNLRKSPGGYTSDNKRLKVVAKEDKNYIEGQILLYDADLIICCGVGDLFKGIISFGKSFQWTNTKRGIPFCEFAPGRFIVSYSHPEARIQDNVLYYGLLDAIREIYKVI